MSEAPTVPDALVDAILGGRCVAFVGAGFSAPVAPAWKSLLEQLWDAANPGAGGGPAELISGASPALDFEAAGEVVRRAFRGDAEAFERAAQRILSIRARSEADGVMSGRLAHLRGIPFEAILTTNMDDLLSGSPPEPQTYCDVLRQRLGWWDRARWDEKIAWPRSTVLKLHGDANGRADDNPLVLSRSDYRRLVYEDSRYANFLRSILATRTVLYLGVSFTDAYLNELRSEVLALVRSPKAATEPLGYAVVPDKSAEWQRYFLEHEGIQVLPYTSGDGGRDHSGFDAWLRAIHDRTSAQARLGTLLGGGSIVWVDPTPANNRYGVERLSKAGVGVTELSGPNDLREADHAGATLLITHFGYRGDDAPSAVQVLHRVRGWAEHPPVIVFATHAYGDQNRRTALRRGAFEYASTWSELFRLIEQLLGRVVGA